MLQAAVTMILRIPVQKRAWSDSLSISEKKQRVKPGDILGAVAGETGMPGSLVGAIDMYDKYTFVEVPKEYGREVLEAMKNAKIKGKSINMEPANQK